MATDIQSTQVCEQSKLFTAGESGYFTFRIPAMVVSLRDTVLTFAEARRNTGADDDDIDLVLKRSSDGGSSWQPIQVLFQNGTRSVNQPTPVVDRNTGDIILVFCKDNREVFVSKSTDDGATWSDPDEITGDVVDPQWAYIGTGPGHGTQLSSGRILIPSWGDVTHGPFITRPGEQIQQFSYAVFSDDRGATWQRGASMDLDSSDECMAVETSDGAIYMDMRSPGKQQSRAYAWSTDGGATWSPVRYHEHLPAPSCQGSIVRCSSTADGKRNRIIMAHPSHRTERERMAVLLSYDECQSWPVERVLNEDYSGYSDLAVAADGTIFCLYETDRCRALTFARFNQAWLTAGDETR